MLHFAPAEFDDRMARLRAEMAGRRVDGMLLFAPESHFWLTGFDTFGFCHFQCLVIGEGAPVLLTRSADLRQAELTSTITDIRIWKDSVDARPGHDLAALIADLGLSGKRLGIETDTHGLTAANYLRLAAALGGRAELVEASDLVPDLRLTKSPAELAYVRRAGQIADAGFLAARAAAAPGADEGRILAAMQGAMLAEGGDFAANDIVIGSSNHALLCRSHSGRRVLSQSDQLTLEWAGVWRHYHAALMRTFIIGSPRGEHERMFAAAKAALLACEAALRPEQRMGAVYDAHQKTLDEMGFGRSRLNACGYALGARFAPSWMEGQMFFKGAPTRLKAGQCHFLHMVLMDSETGAAMTLGRTSLVTRNGAAPLSTLPLELVVLG